jgi:hypothetical protein
MHDAPRCCERKAQERCISSTALQALGVRIAVAQTTVLQPDRLTTWGVEGFGPLLGTFSSRKRWRRHNRRRRCS